MAEQNLTLNLINFFPEEKEKAFSFSFEKKEGFYPIAKKEFPVNISDIFSEEQLQGVEHLYTDFSATGDKKSTLKINIYKSRKFAKHYFNLLINKYFEGKGLIINSNFVHDTEVWIENPKESNEDFTAYFIYVVKVQIARVTKEAELVLSYDGVTKLFKKSLQELDFDTQDYNWCIYQNKCYKYEERPEEAKYNDQLVFPVLNNKLKRAMGLPTIAKKISNKYKIYFDQIADFYTTYINTNEFKHIIPIDKNGFHTVKEDKIKKTSFGSNNLLFGNKKQNINPYFGIQTDGPYQLPKGDHFKFIYVFHDADKAIVNELKEWFSGSKSGFDGIKKYVRLNYSGDNQNSIIIKDLDNAIEEVREQLVSKVFDPKVKYIAIYLSPFSKEETDEVKHSLYYLLKEELLKYKITSQVIEKFTLEEEGWTTSLKNISIAIVAKLNGIPWRLHREIKSELIVGIGAFRNTSLQQKFIGSAFCFANDGQFKGFNCFSEDDHFMLAGSIQKAVRKFHSENENVKRLIIHFYKEMSYDELQPILENLNALNLNIPVFIITINKTESKEYVVFDNNFAGKIPLSGTFIHIGWNQFLLCNNTRYTNSTVSKIDSFPFPVRIKISSTDEKQLDDMKVVVELVDQVYQFSRMYWKSLRQQNIPVTIKYPEMVAQVFPYFENKTLPPFGENNLWFL